MEDANSLGDDGDSRRPFSSHQAHCSVGHKRSPWSLLWGICSYSVLRTTVWQEVTLSSLGGKPRLTVTGLAATAMESWVPGRCASMVQLEVYTQRLRCFGGRLSSLPVGECLPSTGCSWQLSKWCEEKTSTGWNNEANPYSWLWLKSTGGRRLNSFNCNIRLWLWWLSIMKALNTNKLDIFKDIVFLFLVRVKISVTLKMPIASSMCW